MEWSYAAATYRSELSAPLVASRSSTPSPSFRPSTFARNWRTLEIASLLYGSVLTIKHLSALDV